VVVRGCRLDRQTAQRTTRSLVRQLVSVCPKDFGILTTHPKFSKYFKRSKKSHFWSKILSILLRILIGVKHCVPCVVFLCYHWTRCGKFHHVRPHGFERPCLKAIFLPSIFCRSLSGNASPLRRRKHLLDKTYKCSINLPNLRSHSCTSSHVLVFPLNAGSLLLLLKPCHLVTGLFWDVMGSFACLFDVFYYSESTAMLTISTIFDSGLDPESHKHASFTKEK